MQARRLSVQALACLVALSGFLLTASQDDGKYFPWCFPPSEFRVWCTRGPADQFREGGKGNELVCKFMCRGSTCCPPI